MSKIGKKSIQIPAGVEIQINGSTVIVKGPKGQLSHTFAKGVLIKIENNEVITAVENEEQRNLRGLSRTLLANMIEGVTNGYEKKLLLT
jgi:large subunit ribosomal protein L6